MLPPAVIHPANEAAVAFDAVLDAHVVSVAGVDVLAGTAAECDALLDEWSRWSVAAWRAMMSPVLAGWDDGRKVA